MQTLYCWQRAWWGKEWKERKKKLNIFLHVLHIFPFQKRVRECLNAPVVINLWHFCTEKITALHENEIIKSSCCSAAALSSRVETGKWVEMRKTKTKTILFCFHFITFFSLTAPESIWMVELNPKWVCVPSVSAKSWRRKLNGIPWLSVWCVKWENECGEEMKTQEG